jgi:hypothetical protein
LPVLVSVTGWLALAVPTLWLPNDKLLVESETEGPAAVAARAPKVKIEIKE